MGGFVEYMGELDRVMLQLCATLEQISVTVSSVVRYVYPSIKRIVE